MGKLQVTCKMCVYMYVYMHEFISYNVLLNKNIFKAVSHPLNIVPSQTVNTV